MNRDRYEELLGVLFDGTLSLEQAGELAAGLQSDAGLLRDLREHLVLWELWSQTLAPERSGDAFVAAWETRLRAESESAGAFGGRVLARVAARNAPVQLRAGFFAAIRRAAGWLQRPMGIAWTAALAGVAALAIFWLASSRSARAAVVIHGDAVCTACTLHEGHGHHPAVRVTANGVTHIYYLDPNQALIGSQNRFCAGPTPVTVEGTAREEDGRLRFSVRSVTFAAPSAPPKQGTPDR